MRDILAEVKEILALHLGTDPSRLVDDTRLEALGADSLDVIEIVMSCEERFGVEIPNSEAGGLVTLGDTVRCVEAQLQALVEAQVAAAQTARRPRRLSLALR